MAVYLQLKSKLNCPILHFEVLGIPYLVSKSEIVGFRH